MKRFILLITVLFMFGFTELFDYGFGTCTAIDNVEYTIPTTQVVTLVPEPATMLLFGSGLIVLASLSCKKIRFL